MYLVRFLLIVMVMISASLSSAMAASHSGFADRGHGVMEMATNDQVHCCKDGTERTQSCHVLPALLPGAELHQTAPVTGEDVFAAVGLFLTGFEPSGPLDPPRTM
jgi:hypothetical protein